MSASRRNPPSADHTLIRRHTELKSPIARFLTRTNEGPLIEFVKYFIASGIALGVDYCIYRVVAQYWRVALPKAAVIGYLGGLIVAYFLIGKGVFREGWLKDRRIYESLLFVCSGLLGLAITYLVVAAYVYLFGPMLNEAKIVAALCSFLGVYLFRKFLVFKKSINTLTLAR